MTRAAAEASCACGATLQTEVSGDLAASSMVDAKLRAFYEAHRVCRERLGGAPGEVAIEIPAADVRVGL